MAKFFSKKALAIVLTLAMLVSCMAFSFSAGAALSQMVRNDYENGSDTNWLSKYSATEVSTHSTGTANYADYYADTDGNGTMKLGFGSGGESGISGYWFFSGAGNYHDGGVGGWSQFPNATYMVQLKYKVLTMNSNVNAQVAINFGMAQRYNFYYSENTSKTYGSFTNTAGGTASVVATVDNSDVGAGWQTAVGYLNLTTSSNDYKAHIFASTGGGYQDSLSGTEILIDDVYIYKYDTVADVPVDPSVSATMMWENNFDNDADASNWASYYKTTSRNSNANWHTNFHSDPVKATAGNYASLEDGAMKIGFGTNESAENYISAFFMKHQFATKAGATSYGTGGTRTANSAYGDFVPAAGKYAIKFDYMVNTFNEASASSVNLNVGYRTAEGYLDGNKSLSVISGYTTMLTVDADDVSSEWKTAVGYIEAPSNIWGGLIFFANVANNSSSDLTNCEVLVDNFEIYSYTSLPTVSFIYSGNEIGSAFGLPGSAFVMPALSGLSSDAEISYYADEALTTTVTLPTTYSNVDQTIYVKAKLPLKNNLWSFDNDTDTAGAHISAKTSNIWQGGVRQIKADYAHTGTNSLLMNFENAVDSKRSNRNQFFLYDGSGNQVAVEAGKDYLISYWVMIPKGSNFGETFKGNLWLAGTDNYYMSGTAVQGIFFDDTTTGYFEVPCDGEWHKITRYIDGSKIRAKDESDADDTGTVGNVLVGFQQLNWSSVPSDYKNNLPVYLDDIDLICLNNLITENDREQYLFEGTGTEGTATHLHSHSTNGTGVYTSVRLGATYTAADENGDTIILNDAEYDLAERGIVVGTTDMVLHSAGAKNVNYKWVSSKTEGFNTAWEIADNQFTYTLRLANISKELIDAETKYIYRSYYKIAMPGVYAEAGTNTLQDAVTVQGTVSPEISFLDIYNACSANGTDGASWFN